MIAGWIRTVGQVTAVSHVISLVTTERPPRTDQMERALALLVVPGMEVIRDTTQAEPGIPSASAAAVNHLGRAQFLEREGDPKLRHAARFPPSHGSKHPVRQLHIAGLAAAFPGQVAGMEAVWHAGRPLGT